MLESKDNQYAIKVDINGQALSQEEVEFTQKRLKASYKSNLSFVFAIFVLGAGVTYRAFALDFDKDHELFNISLYIGLWFGLFTGAMIDGNGLRKLQMIIVGIIISSSAGLFAAMLVMLFIGQATVWITSVNILASSLASMWVLTRYDEVLQGIESTRFVTEKQFSYIKKASSHFKELTLFSEKIIAEERMPLAGEYWAFREWVQNKAANNK